ncbi:MAG TPA: DUF2939 domain-containing protein [Methylomirabilota bacterium]
MPGRIVRWSLPAASLLLAVLVAWYYLMGTPQYSVYRLTAALHDRDVTAAERFIDVNRVAQSASDVIVVDYLTREPKAAQALEALGQGGARATAARALEPLVAARVRAEIRKMADRGGSGPGGFVLPAGIVAAFWEPQVARDGEDAWLTYTDRRGGQTRFRASQQPDRSWMITEFDREWVRHHLKDAPAG